MSRRHDARSTVLHDDVDFIPEFEAELSPHLLGDGDLALAGDPHQLRVTLVLLPRGR